MGGMSLAILGMILVAGAVPKGVQIHFQSLSPNSAVWLRPMQEEKSPQVRECV